jgi:hypothetical protein
VRPLYAPIKSEKQRCGAPAGATDNGASTDINQSNRADTIAAQYSRAFSLGTAMTESIND